MTTPARLLHLDMVHRQIMAERDGLQATRRAVAALAALTLALTIMAASPWPAFAGAAISVMLACLAALHAAEREALMQLHAEIAAQPDEAPVGFELSPPRPAEPVWQDRLLDDPIAWYFGPIAALQFLCGMVATAL